MNLKYLIGQSVKIVYDLPDKNNLTVLNNNPTLVYQVPSLDPTIRFYFPLAPETFSGKYNDNINYNANVNYNG